MGRATFIDRGMLGTRLSCNLMPPEGAIEGGLCFLFVGGRKYYTVG